MICPYILKSLPDTEIYENISQEIVHKSLSQYPAWVTVYSCRLKQPLWLVYCATSKSSFALYLSAEQSESNLRFVLIAVSQLLNLADKPDEFSYITISLPRYIFLTAAIYRIEGQGVI